MRHAAETLTALGVDADKRIVSAHRTPTAVRLRPRAPRRRLQDHHRRRDGAAPPAGHGGGMTELPVFGVPVESKALSGLDSLYSIVQMPAGFPSARSDR